MECPVIDTGIIDYRLLTAPELAAMVLQLRKEHGWTQETLAELARVSVRTIQRLEDGQPSSGDTRRAVAGAFGFEDLDAFSKPWPLPNIEKLKEEAARIERETVSVEVIQITKGKQLSELAEQSDCCLITSIDETDDEVDALVAVLQECFVEYADCHDLYSPTGKLGVCRHFQEQISELAAKGVGLVGGLRRVRLRPSSPQFDDPGILFDIVYVVAGPANGLPKSIRVPRNSKFGI